MIDFKEHQISPKELLKCSIIVGFLNLIFFLLTKETGWISDDYPLVFSTKLFNLINEQIFFIKDIFALSGQLGPLSETRLVPFYYLIFQWFPDDYVLFHGIVIIFFFLSSLLVFVLAQKITNSANVSLLTSILYTIHYSISIKSLSWNCFSGHILNSAFGFLSIYLFILFLEKKKNRGVYLLFFILFSLIGSLIMESGLIYPLIAFLITFFFKRDNLFLNSALSILPILIYILLVFIHSGKFLPLFAERLKAERSNYHSKIFNINNDNKLHFYRSTYAPRDLKGYTLRVFDNLLSSINISSLEKTIKSYDKNNYLKNFIKENLILLAIFFLLFLTLFIFFLIKKINNMQNKNILKKIFYIYLIIFAVYTFIFYRKDLNIALSFPVALILSILVINFYKMNKKITSYLILFLFITPSLLYASTSFEYFSDHGSRKTLNKITKKYFEYANQDKLDRNIIRYEGYKYFFYYQNYKNYKNYLSKYKDISFKDFVIKFNENE